MPFYVFADDFRDPKVGGPKIVSLPQYFKNVRVCRNLRLAISFGHLIWPSHWLSHLALTLCPITERLAHVGQRQGVHRLHVGMMC